MQIAIAGKGMFRDPLLEQTNILGLEQGQVVLRVCPSEDLPWLLISSVDAFIMPSTAELQSIATLEAMSCGCLSWPPNATVRCPSW